MPNACAMPACGSRAIIALRRCRMASWRFPRGAPAAEAALQAHRGAKPRAALKDAEVSAYAALACRNFLSIMRFKLCATVRALRSARAAGWQLLQRGDVGAHDFGVEPVGRALGLQVARHFLGPEGEALVADLLGRLDQRLHRLIYGARGVGIARYQRLQRCSSAATRARAISALRSSTSSSATGWRRARHRRAGAWPGENRSARRRRQGPT